jgi:hypothetical protein
MRNLLALVGFVVVGFVGAGWYLGWYKLGVDSHDPSHPTIKVEVETDKIKQDVKKEVKAVGTSFQSGQVAPQADPTVLPPLPAPPAPPPFSGTTVPPVNITLPPPPSFAPNP